MKTSRDDTKETLDLLNQMIDRQGSDESLWEEYHRTKSNGSRDQLIAFHMPIVIKLAKQVQKSFTYPKSMMFGDFVSWGVLGLIHAIERFDPSRGFAFSTYAFHSVKGFMRTGVKKFSGINGSRDELNRRFYERMVSLTGGEMEKPSWSHLSFMERIEAKELYDAFQTCLNEREREILRLRYQLECPMREIAGQVGCSVQAVQQSLKRIEAKIRKQFAHVVSEQ